MVLSSGIRATLLLQRDATTLILIERNGRVNKKDDTSSIIAKWYRPGRRARRPDPDLCDLNMLFLNGHDLLERTRAQHELQGLVVVLMTRSNILPTTDEFTPEGKVISKQILQATR